MDKVTINILKDRIASLKNIPDAIINHLEDKPDLLTYEEVSNYLGFRKVIKECTEQGILKEVNGLITKQSLIELIESVPAEPRIKPFPQCLNCQKKVGHLIKGLCPRCFYSGK